MPDWRSTCVAPTDIIKTAISVIDRSALQIALVVDENLRLLGVVTDGDVRRAILRGVSFDQPVSEIMFTSFTAVKKSESRENILKIMRQRKLHHIPVITDNGQVVDLKIIMDLESELTKVNPVVIMAGGLGTRLRPLTNNCPKPMIKVGDKPILETILENFAGQGFKKIYVSVNYKAEIIEEYFANGQAWDLEITYLRERERMGTAGALSLLPETPEYPLVVMNGDLLTKVNFGNLIDFHIEHQALGTMCVRQYDMRVPYGVVEIDAHKVKSLIEKPVHSFFVNAGIYVLEPETLKYIPAGTYSDMTDLFDHITALGRNACAFPIREYWIDIGRMSEYEQANGEFHQHFVKECQPTND